MGGEGGKKKGLSYDLTLTWSLGHTRPGLELICFLSLQRDVKQDILSCKSGYVSSSADDLESRDGIAVSWLVVGLFGRMPLVAPQELLHKGDWTDILEIHRLASQGHGDPVDLLVLPLHLDAVVDESHESGRHDDTGECAG